MKRQNEVAADYGRLVADQIITPSNIIEAVLKGLYSDKVFAMIGRHVQKAIDDQTSIAKPFVTFTVGTRNYIRMKETPVERIVNNMPDTLKHVESYADDALDLQNTLVTRLQALSP